MDVFKTRSAAHRGGESGGEERGGVGGQRGNRLTGGPRVSCNLSQIFQNSLRERDKGTARSRKRDSVQEGEAPKQDHYQKAKKLGGGPMRLSTLDRINKVAQKGKIRKKPRTTRKTDSTSGANQVIA